MNLVDRLFVWVAAFVSSTRGNRWKAPWWLDYAQFSVAALANVFLVGSAVAQGRITLGTMAVFLGVMVAWAVPFALFDYTNP